MRIQHEHTTNAYLPNYLQAFLHNGETFGEEEKAWESTLRENSDPMVQLAAEILYGDKTVALDLLNQQLKRKTLLAEDINTWPLFKLIGDITFNNDENSFVFIEEPAVGEGIENG